MIRYGIYDPPASSGTAELAKNHGHPAAERMWTGILMILAPGEAAQLEISQRALNSLRFADVE